MNNIKVGHSSTGVSLSVFGSNGNRTDETITRQHEVDALINELVKARNAIWPWPLLRINEVEIPER